MLNPSSRCWRRVLVALAALILDAQLGHGQVVTVPYALSCASCRVVREKVASFGSLDDPVLLRGLAQVARDSRGRYFATGFPRGTVVVFSSEGKFLTTFGRPGSGPGEFPSLVAGILIGPGDSIYVFDAHRGVHIFAPSLTYVRRMTLPARMVRSGAVLSDGRILLADAGRSPETIGFPFQLFAPGGRLLKAFGPRADTRPGVLAAVPRIAVVRGDNLGLWTTEAGRDYRLDSWGFDGRRGQSVRIESAPWMKIAQAAKSGAAVRPLFADAAGRLWVHGSIADPGFKPDPREPLAGSRFTRLSGSTDSFIEVLDTRTWAVLASIRFDEHFWPLGNSGLVYSVREDADGVVSMDVWRLRLAQANP